MKLKTALLGAAALATLAPAAWAERGADGEVKLTFPQAVSIMTPYLSGGTKDIWASSMVLEPMAGIDADGNLVTKLASEIPTLANGGVSADMTSIGSIARILPAAARRRRNSTASPRSKRWMRAPSR